MGPWAPPRTSSDGPSTAKKTAGSLPEAALAASLGCGNPTLLADLRPGEVVLDLGSGGGIDVLLSARRVAPSGKAYGLDMTAEMLELARRNQTESGVTNAEFLEGTMEAVPLPDESVDVIISNCVVNLSPDKPAVLREAFRVLRPGGRLAVSDIVLRRALPEELQRLMGLWTGCVAGALVEGDYGRSSGPPASKGSRSNRPTSTTAVTSWPWPATSRPPGPSRTPSTSKRRSPSSMGR